jgi:hypothetical protein
MHFRYALDDYREAFKTLMDRQVVGKVTSLQTPDAASVSFFRCLLCPSLMHVIVMVKLSSGLMVGVCIDGLAASKMQVLLLPNAQASRL